MSWTAMEIEDVKEKQLKALLAEGFTVRDAAEEMGMSKSAVQRLKKKMEQSA